MKPKLRFYVEGTIGNEIVAGVLYTPSYLWASPIHCQIVVGRVREESEENTRTGWARL